MLTDWLRRRRALHADLDNANALNAQLAIEVEDLGDENEALREQLATSRIEFDAQLTAARAELAALKADPAHQQLQREKARADALAHRLDEVQCKTLALDVPFS